MKVSERLNILSQIINLSLFLYLSVYLIVEGSLGLVELIILGYGLLGSLIISIISQIEKLRGE